MKNIVLIFVLFFCTHSLFSQTNSQKVNENVVKNVVLINKNPWEVLMTKNGDILAKLKDVPDYLIGFEKDSDLNIAKEMNGEKPQIVLSKPVVTATETKSASKERVISNEDFNSKMSDDRLEVVFNLGSALLNSNQISLLNEISKQLVSNRNLKYNIFGFNSEPEYRFYILSKRRMDAVLSYLKVKGVDIDNQIIVNSSVKGKNNKIVFAPTR